MALAKKKPQKKTAEELIYEELGKVYKKVEVKRYNAVSVRVRVKDASFKGLTSGDRQRHVYKTLSELPSSVQAEITMLILVAPGEQGNPLANHEFDHPSPDTL